MEIRLATNNDSRQIIDLIDSVYREYDDAVNLQGAEADLLDLQQHYFDKRGAFWVLEDEGRVLGTHAALRNADDPSICNFKRLYLNPNLRGTPWSQALMQLTIDWARAQGCRRVEFWSDTRFSRAHRFFDKFGFQKTGQVREMHDGHIPYSEYFYFLPLDNEQQD
jgi:putative acetyltransferase